MNCHIRTTCRLCSGRLTLAQSFTPTPPANAFVKEPVEQERFGLDVMLCQSCGHAQLRQVVDPKLLFENYVYVSGTSPSFVQHFLLYSASIEAKCYPTLHRPFAVEIGSNDGTLLKALLERNFRVLGVEPAVDISEKARQGGIPTLTTFFSPDLAREIVYDHGLADVVIANNVFAHIDDLAAVVEGVKVLLHKDGLFVAEVQYVGDLLKNSLFDMVYHEHVSYHAFTPLFNFLQKLGMRIVDVHHVQTHGGSLRVWATKEGGKHQPTEKVRQLLLEEEQGDFGLTAWHKLAENVELRRDELHTLLKTLKGRSIVGYGAPAKATTFCHQMGLSRADLEYIIDDSPLKQGLFTPGLHIPVKGPAALYNEDGGWPDAILILAWNFAPQIIEKHQALREGGVHFITPFPVLSVTP